MANTVDADFLALPLSTLSDAAIDAAQAAGASHVDVRIERTRTGYLSLRDAKPETQSDESNLGIGVRVIVDGAWTQPREWAGDITSMKAPALVINDFNMSTVSPGS